MTQHNYIKIMANTIIDDETVNKLIYRQLNKHSKYKKIWNKLLAKKLVRLSQLLEGRGDGTDTIFS